MRSRIRTLANFSAAMALAVGFAPSARSQTNVIRTYLTNYSATNHSVWPAGFDRGSNLTPTLLGPAWNFGGNLDQTYALTIPGFSIAGINFPPIDLGKTGFLVNFSSSGKLGLEMRPQYDGGRMNFSYMPSVSVQYPRFPLQGSTVTITANWRPGVGYFTTTSPSFGLGIDAVAQFAGQASGEGWFLGDRKWAGSIFNKPDTGEYRANIVPPQALSQNTLQQFFNLLNFGTGLINPIPISPTVSVPVLEVNETSARTDGSIFGQAYSPFLSIETDALAWITSFMGPGGGPLGLALSGNYPIPAVGADFSINWDIAKAYANLDFGFLQRFQVIPSGTVSFNVRNGRTNALLSTSTWNPNTATASSSFVMPNDPIVVEPVMNTTFDLDHLFAFGVNGSIGYSPIRVGAQGSIGFGKHRQVVSVDFDPAGLAWRPDPTAGSKISQHRFRLNTGDALRTFPPIRVNLANLTDLSRVLTTTWRDYDSSLFNDIARVDAYATDPDKTYGTITISPEQGRSLFATPAAMLPRGLPNPMQLSATFRKDGTGTPATIPVESITDSSAALRVPRDLLEPGQHTITVVHSNAVTAGGWKSATYVIPLWTRFRTPEIDGQLYRAMDRSGQPTNRIIAGTTPVTLYTQSRNAYWQTEALLNNGLVVPSTVNARDSRPDDVPATFGFTLSPELQAQLAGTEQVLRLRNPNLWAKTDGSAGDPLMSPVNSGAQTFFIVAPRPQINRVEYMTYPINSLALGATDLWLELRGTGFSGTTKFYGRATTGHLTHDFLLESSFVSSTVARVSIPASFQRELFLGLGNAEITGFSLFAQTETRDIPARGSDPAVTSGGTSPLVSLPLAYFRPAVNRIESSTLARGVQNKFRVFGEGLYRPRTSQTTLTTFSLGGRSIPLGSVSWPAGTGMFAPYVDITVDGSYAVNAGAIDLRVENRGQSSGPIPMTVNNPVPRVTSIIGPLYNRPGDGEQVLRVSGAAFYPESTFWLNGTHITNTNSIFVDPTRRRNMVITNGAIRNMEGSTLDAWVENPAPGGGASTKTAIDVFERDPGLFRSSVSRPTFDRGLNAWRANVTVVYIARRKLDSRRLLQFPSLPPGLTVRGATLVGGVPSLALTSTASRLVVPIIIDRGKNIPVNVTASIGFSD